MSVQLLFLCPDEVQIFGLRKLLGARWQIGIFHRNKTDIGASVYCNVHVNSFFIGEIGDAGLSSIMKCMLSTSTPIHVRDFNTEEPIEYASGFTVDACRI